MEASKSILLVEDDRDDQLFFIKALEKIKGTWLFDVAENGKAALEKLEKAEVLPDLIFMDIHMPVMNGIECLSEINKQPKMKNIPVVILSDALEKIDVVRRLGAKAFVEKPIDSRYLREPIAKMIKLDFNRIGEIANHPFQTILAQI